MEQSPAPPGGDQNRGIESLIIKSVLISLATFIVTFRLIARSTSRKGYGWDDWTMLLALVMGIIELGLDVAAEKAGAGRHMHYLPLPEAEQALKWINVSEFLTLLALCLVKVSVVLFLLRIGNLKRWLRTALVVNMAILVLSTTALLIVLLVQCRPIQANWDLAVKATATCISMDSLVDISYLTTAISILTDAVCVILPFPIVWNLKMPQKTKISVLAILCLGFFAAICGIVRITEVKDLKGTTDPTWVITPLGIWTTAELYIGVIAGSIPPCRSLFLSIVSRLRGNSEPIDENTIGIKYNRSGGSYLMRNLSRISDALSRNRGSPPGSSKGQIDVSTTWESREEARYPVRDNGSDKSVLPLVSVSVAAANSESTESMV